MCVCVPVDAQLYNETVTHIYVPSYLPVQFDFELTRSRYTYIHGEATGATHRK